MLANSSEKSLKVMNYSTLHDSLITNSFMYINIMSHVMIYFLKLT